MLEFTSALAEQTSEISNNARETPPRYWSSDLDGKNLRTLKHWTWRRFGRFWGDIGIQIFPGKTSELSNIGPGALGAPQTLDLELLGRSWGTLGRSWGALGALLGALGALLDALGALLDALGTLLGLSWGALGALLEISLGDSLF